MINQQPATSSLAHHCINHVNTKTNTAGAYSFEGKDFSDYEKETKNTYRTPEGKECSSDVCAEILGISTTFTITLFTKYNSDYEYIYKNHGKDKPDSKYKNKDGTPNTAIALSNYYDCSVNTIYRAYDYVNNDNEKAHREIIKTLELRKEKAE